MWTVARSMGIFVSKKREEPAPHSTQDTSQQDTALEGTNLLVDSSRGYQPISTALDGTNLSTDNSGRYLTTNRQL